MVEEVKKSEGVTGPTVDWVTYGAVSPVKNQGSCTASYAFSAVGAVEGVSVIFFKNQVEYSAQQLVDCSQSYGNSGCVTGNMVNSFNFIRDRGIYLPNVRNFNCSCLSLHRSSRNLQICYWYIQSCGICFN